MLVYYANCPFFSFELPTGFSLGRCCRSVFVVDVICFVHVICLVVCLVVVIVVDVVCYITLCCRSCKFQVLCT